MPGMRTRLLAVPTLAVALLAVTLAAPTPAAAQVDVQVSLNLGLPVRPPLVAIQPGVMVVEDFDDEVFVVEGIYWARRGDRWYRAGGPRAAFVVVERHRVPPALVRLPPGQYKKWRKKHPEAAARLEGRDHDHRHDDHGKQKHKGKGKGHDKH
jgi:hypothetical protein